MSRLLTDKHDTKLIYSTYFSDNNTDGSNHGPIIAAVLGGLILCACVIIAVVRYANFPSRVSPTTKIATTKPNVWFWMCHCNTSIIVQNQLIDLSYVNEKKIDSSSFLQLTLDDIIHDKDIMC